MANGIRTVDFLPEIFQTEKNKEFLSSTLDQLVQEPKLTATQGYIGRRSGPGVNPADNYIPEPTTTRNNYQLEPGVTFLKPNTSIVSDAITFPGIIDRLSSNDANTTRYDRLFNSEYYSWDPFVDFDKYVNFGQYFWLPSGPDSVDVSSTDILLTDDFTVTRTSKSLTFSGEPGNLPTIILARQGNYTFDVNSVGNSFYIQTSPGIDGTVSYSSRSNREILGVTNNGEDVGTVTFNVPRSDAQDFYFTLTDEGSVDFVTDIKLDQINGQRLSEFLAEYNGIDGIQDLRSRTVIFLETTNGLAGGWTLDGSTEIEDDATKYSVWRINYSTDADPILSLSVVKPIANRSKLYINFGNQNSGSSYYKTASGYYEQIPLITASADVLYYQDSTNADLFGVIRLVDQPTNISLDINEILNSSEYTSPNGIVFTNGLKVQFEGVTSPASYSGKEYYVEGVGSQITLTAVQDLITPETYTRSNTVPFDSSGFDVGGFEDTLNAPLDPDYFTVNRSSLDLNPWSRSNRWFHIDVIYATAEYNNTVAVLDNEYRAKRPILEFKPSLRLYNFGTQNINSINVIDFSATDAFSDINGTIGYSVDGYSLAQNSKIIFANDADPAVRNKIYTVNFVQFDSSSEKVIDLQPADITTPGAVADQSVLVISGIENQGKIYYYNGTSWIFAQQKNSVNQAPLFDVFDSNGYSFSDTSIYPGSSFTGTKLFSYARGSGTADSVLNIPLRYLTINNIGDIVFDNNLYVDTFTYVSGRVSTELNVSTGFVRQYTSISAYNDLIGWQTSNTQVTSRQSFTFEYNGNNLVLDVLVDETTDAVPVKIFVDNEFLLPTQYTYATNAQGNTTISFVTAPTVGSIIEVSVVSKQASKVAYYNVPYNLENNAINENSSTFTLGTARAHYNTICQNSENFTGKINGANNIRDLGNVVPYGSNIVQHSSPLTFASAFLQKQSFAFFGAIEWAGFQYEKTKNLILNEVAKNDWSGYTTADILDEVLEILNVGKNENSPFYWSDTL